MIANTSYYEYDGEDRLIKFTDARGRLLSETDTLGRTTAYQYDEVNNLIQQTDALGNVIFIGTYDAMQNPLSITDAIGNTINYEYDSLNRLIETADPLNRITAYEYDVMNRLIQSTDAIDGEAEQEFDTDGNRTALIDPNNNRLEFSFNLAGQLTEMNSDTGSVSYEYNQLGLLFTLTNGRGQETTLQYDDAGRLIEKISPETTAVYAYDDGSNLLTAANDTTYLYDAEGKWIGIEVDGEETQYTINPNAYLSQVLMETDSQGNSTYYVYGLGLLGEENSGLYRTYHYDLRGSTTALTDEIGTVTDTFQYGPYGELVKRTGETETPFLYNGKWRESS